MKRYVAAATSTLPARAVACIRAATFTASPIAVYSFAVSLPIMPTTTGPVLMPTRMRRSLAPFARCAAPSSSIARAMSNPQRTARSGSSSCATGAPKNARTPSPMSRAIVPSYCSIVPVMRLNASPTSVVQSSGSMRSAIEVEPAMSANRTVIERRSPDAVGRVGMVSRAFTPTNVVVARAGGRSARKRVLASQNVERAGDDLEDLRLRALGEAIADHVAAARRFDRTGIAEHADVLAGRGRRPIDDAREIAGGERRLGERADDLDARHVGDALDEIARLALVSRRDQLLLRDFDRLGIDRRGPPALMPTAGFIPLHSRPVVAFASHPRNRFRRGELASARKFIRTPHSRPCGARR